MADMKVTMVDVDSVDSTNTYVMKNGDELPDLTLFSAQKQTAGKGRQGRVWVSDSSENLYTTFLMKSWPYAPYQATWLASLAIQEVIHEFAPGVESWIKWPNDIMVGNCKLAGILAESRISQDAPPYIALGMGINLNLSETEVASISPTPTSLNILIKNLKNIPNSPLFLNNFKINRTFFKEKLAISLIRVYFKALEFGISSIFKDWSSQNGLINRSVIFTLPNGTEDRGTVQGVTEDGEIVIQTDSGVHPYSCGDIQLSKELFKI